jgi:Fur family ferric uptake transcriptional regulator
MKAHRTRSQEQIFRLLTTLNRAISAQELYLELRQRSQNMGLASVIIKISPRQERQS